MATKPEYRIDPHDSRKSLVVREWSLEKHDLIAKYIDGTRSMRVRWPRRTYTELFCATGRVCLKESGKFIPGTALRAWEASRKSGVEFTEIYVNDLDRESVETCRARLEELGATVSAFNLPAVEAAPTILERLGPGLHLVVLDPFSIGVLPFNALVKPFAAHQRVDLVVNYNLQDLMRNLTHNVLGDADELDDFCPGWRDAINGVSNRRARRGRILERWLAKLRESGAEYSKEMPLVRDSRRKNTPKYYLVFASHHESPIRVWGDVARNPNRDLFA